MLEDTTGQAFSGGLPIPADLAAFETAELGCSAQYYYAGMRFPIGDLQGSITSWVVTPEPGSLLLVGGMLGFLGRRKVRSISEHR